MKRLTLNSRVAVTIIAMFAGLLVGSGTATASVTSWDCDHSPSTWNTCPAGSKYSRAKMDYVITGGSGSSTDWTIQQRIFGGSIGGNIGPLERWRLYLTKDYKWNGSSWVYLGQTGGGSWRTDFTWSPDFTVGSSRSITDSLQIDVLTLIEHEYCIWTYPDGINRVCLSAGSYIHTQENFADN